MRGSTLDGNMWLRWAGLLVAAFLAVPAAAALAQQGEPSLRSGAVELGLSGSFVSVEGVATSALVLRGGYFIEVPGGVGEIEAKGSFLHVSSLDAVDLEAVVSWNYRVAESGNYAFVSLGGGIRRESVGSFGLTRYPLGFGAGWRSLIGRRAGIRAEYQFRRILNDPVSDVSEHQVLLGLSVFFRNADAKTNEE